MEATITIIVLIRVITHSSHPSADLLLLLLLHFILFVLRIIFLIAVLLLRWHAAIRLRYLFHIYEIIVIIVHHVAPSILLLLHLLVLYTAAHDIYFLPIRHELVLIGTLITAVDLLNLVQVGDVAVSAPIVHLLMTASFLLLLPFKCPHLAAMRIGFIDLRSLRLQLHIGHALVNTTDIEWIKSVSFKVCLAIEIHIFQRQRSAQV